MPAESAFQHSQLHSFVEVSPSSRVQRFAGQERRTQGGARYAVAKVANITCEFAGNALKLRNGKFFPHSTIAATKTRRREPR
jgi:hypothetical protein